MKFFKSIYFIWVVVVFISGDLLAQKESIEITGKILEGSSKQPVEFATIMIANSNTNKPITGITSSADGTFSVTSDIKSFYIKISFISFVTKKITDFQIINDKVDLGIVLLYEDQQTLDEVVVRGEKSQLEFKLDKRVFNVGKDLSTTGASALEVLNNVPSVNVTIEGAISLRGSTGVQILINGKPSILASEQGNALGTITADMIEKIEVITNPSAKYDAEGTSGIINIIIKKEEKKGVNGSVTINTGTPNNHSFGMSVNRRTEKFNLFSQVGIGHRTFPQDGESVNMDLVNNTTINSIGDSEKNETFYNFILGADYHINKLNVLSLSGHFAYEIETEFSDNDFSLLDETNTLSSEWNRDEATEATNPKWQYELQYKKDFEDHKDHSLLFSALGNVFTKDQSSVFGNTTIFGSLPNGRQETRTDFTNAEYTFKLDYVHPMSDVFTFETGSQYVITDVTNDYAVSDLFENDWIINTNLTNIFAYNQQVLGIYGTGAYEADKFGVKFGIRMENTQLHTSLLNTNTENDQKYTNFFPSLHTSYKVNDQFSLQAGYSKRIFRPRLWDLNPFFNIRNNFNIRTGNPDLQPEFTDSYEITSIFVKGLVSLNFGVYHRYTTEVVERVATFDNNVTTTKPINIGTNRATGVELNAKYSPSDWFSINGDVNYNYFIRKGTFEATPFDFEADRWSTRLNTKFKLPAQIDFELTGNFRSGYKTIQGQISENVFLDLGLRKKILKGKTILNLSVRDVFASRVFENETSQDLFYTYSRRQRGRFITFGISYGFGKGEAMEFSGQKRF